MQRWPATFNEHCDMMKRKQAVHDGDRSHPNLTLLDKMTAASAAVAEATAKMDNRCKSELAIKMGVKTRLTPLDLLSMTSSGDESVDTAMTYSGYKHDIQEAEALHLKHPALFQGFISQMQAKELQHRTRTDPRLSQLSSMKTSLKYPGNARDVAQTERDYITQQHRGATDSQVGG